MMNIRRMVCNPFQENGYIAWDDNRKGVFIDPGFHRDAEKDAVYGFLRDNGIELQAVLLTHGHFDHIYGVARLQKDFGLDVYMCSKDNMIVEKDALYVKVYRMPEPDVDFTTKEAREGDVLKFGDMTFEVIETPGHTPGSISWLERKEGVVFSGDTLFEGTIGRTDLDGGSYDDEILSVMEKLMPLESDVTVCPGHGETTTIGWERTHNPMLQPFNEPETEMDPDAPGIEIHPGL